MIASGAESAASPALAAAQHDGVRARRSPIAVVDRVLPLFWIAAYLVLPTSGLWVEAFAEWVDQGLYLEALRSLLASGHSDLIDTNTIGPAYVASAAFVHDVSGLGPEESLVALNRISYALSVAGAMLLVRRVVRTFTGGLPLVSLAGQLVLLTLVASTGTWIWSDVPWSHFFAMALAVAFYVARFGSPARPHMLAGVAGVLLALLALTRSFEFAAVVVAWLVAAIFFAAAGRTNPLAIARSRLLVGVGGFLAAAAVVHVVTEKRGLFLLYGSNLGHQSADVAADEIAATPVFVPELVPSKLVQLFVDPCYYSTCFTSEQSGRGLWDMPLAIQFPGLALLPLAAVVVAALLGWALRTRGASGGPRRELQLLVELTIASGAMAVGYIASTMSGSAHLKYGFGREFLLPAALANVVVVSLLVAGLWLAVCRLSRARRRGDGSRPLAADLAFVSLIAVAAIGLIPAMHFLRTEGLPQFESRHIDALAYDAECGPSSCQVAQRATTPAGERLSIPSDSLLTFGCGGDASRFSVYVEELRDAVQTRPGCRDPRLVAAWPVVMGLPPTSAELHRVGVVNRP